jgi:hypothetical protein
MAPFKSIDVWDLLHASRRSEALGLISRFLKEGFNYCLGKSAFRSPSVAYFKLRR